MIDRDRFYVELGARIRTCREELHLTQAELAEEIGISRTSLTNIESGRQRILVDQLVGLCKRLSVSATDLIPPNDERVKPRSSRLADMPVVVSFVDSVFGDSTR